MYQILHELLSDKRDGEIFTCFSVWHIAFIVLVFGGVILTILLMKNKSEEEKERVPKAAISIAFGMYILDFFLMPFAYGEIDVEKLPFHACTLTCVLCFLSYHNSFLARFRLQLSLIGLASNLIYVLYPAGVMWYSVNVFCYRAIQTLFFHGIMTVYGILLLAFDKKKPQWRKIHRVLPPLCIMMVWALIGNTIYSGTAGNYSRYFNWFFVSQDPFGMLPADIAPIFAPILTLAAFCVAITIIHLAYFAVVKLSTKKK